MKKSMLQLGVFALLTAFASCNVESDYEKNKSQSQAGRGGARSVEEVFNMDANNDGKLAKSEVSGKLLENFSKFDTNGDGFITKAEYENAPKPEGGRRGGQGGQGRPPRN